MNCLLRRRDGIVRTLKRKKFLEYVTCVTVEVSGVQISDFIVFCLGVS